MEIINRRARFDYFIESTMESGIELVGTEVKSIKNGSANIKDTYIRIKDDEVFITNMYVAKYKEGNIFNHDERRDRKLLLHKKEIKSFKNSLENDGYTLIPLKVYMKKNKIKVLIGLVRGKKLYDKRAAIKEKDLKRLNE